MATETTTPKRSARQRIQRGIQWLQPGMHVKRWLLLIPVGLLLGIVGVILLTAINSVNYFDQADTLFREYLQVSLGSPKVYIPLGLISLVAGMSLIVWSLVAVNRSIVSAVAPEHMDELPELILRKRRLEGGARIVVLGGGTGLSTLLRGLKRHTSNLTAVVTMTDDGGSSGLLQKQMHGKVLPPGDIRNCLVALADAEPLMQQLFQYRFETKEADGLSGHNFGNLLITAMADITGDFEQAVEQTSSILAIRGRVLPSTVEHVVLVGEMADGREITGETAIAKDSVPITRLRLCPDAPAPLPEAVEAIREADIIVMGPGSVFTSVIPNLLVPKIRRALAASKALKIYVCNVMTQPGESEGFSASQHVDAIERHTGLRVFDFVFINTAQPSDKLRTQYEKSGAEWVAPDFDAVKEMGYTAVKGSFINETQVVRHDPDKLADAILRLWGERWLRGK